MEMKNRSHWTDQYIKISSSRNRHNIANIKSVLI